MPYQENAYYPACPNKVEGDRNCNKKLTPSTHGWSCERCNRDDIPSPEYRYLLSVQLKDHTGMEWLMAFQESGEEIMGITAQELFQLKVRTTAGGCSTSGLTMVGL